MSSLQNQDVRMYNNHVESLREASYCKKTCRKILLILQLSTILSKILQCDQDLNKYLQHIPDKYLTQKLNVVNNVLAAEEASEYNTTKKYSCLRKQLQV